MQVEYRTVDPKLIVNEVRNGRSLETIQKLFGIKYKSEVRDLYMKGLAELGEIPKIGFRPGNNSPDPPDPVRKAVPVRRLQSRAHHGTRPPVVIRTNASRTIGQSGSITLNKALLIDDLGFMAGDVFEISREEDRIVLKRIGY